MSESTPPAATITLQPWMYPVLWALGGSIIGSGGGITFGAQEMDKHSEECTQTLDALADRIETLEAE